jgi:hypothetical protein
MTEEQNCVSCNQYVDCKTRIAGMRKIKKNHGSNNREDIRTRIAVMAKLAETCGKWEEE